MTVYLASQSPRRKELLSYLLKDFKVAPADIDETPFADELAEQYVIRMANQKASHCWSNSTDKTDACWVIGSDTIVVFNGQILGKPRDFDDCKTTLRLLSGQRHQVMTSVCLFNGEHMLVELVKTEVEFTTITDEQIEHYWQTGEPQDKAGSYGIQAAGGQFVKRIDGSYSAVVGLPLCETQALLDNALQIGR